MPSLDQHQSLEFVKGVLIGEPGAGKTGALTSLVKAGYKLRVYDFDNLLGTLVQFVKRECPDKLGNVAYQTFTDKMKGVDNPVVMVGAASKVLPFVNGTPAAFISALKQLNRWKNASEDLGVPAEWGADTVVVIDSLTSCSNSAFRYAQALNPAAKEPQTYYFTAQQLIGNLLQLLCAEDFRTNVLVLAHIYYDRNKDGDILKGFPRTIGSALNDQIGSYFNTLLKVEAVGSGKSIRRSIRTNSTGLIDLKNPSPFKLEDSLPIETGLATFFEAVTSL